MCHHHHNWSLWVSLKQEAGWYLCSVLFIQCWSLAKWKFVRINYTDIRRGYRKERNAGKSHDHQCLLIDHKIQPYGLSLLPNRIVRLIKPGLNIVIWTASANHCLDPKERLASKQEEREEGIT